MCIRVPLGSLLLLLLSYVNSSAFLSVIHFHFVFLSSAESPLVSVLVFLQPT